MESNPPSVSPPALESGDCYFDGPNLVFTAAFHLKRGYCCNSGCRHCPYGFKPADAPGVADEAAPPAG